MGATPSKALENIYFRYRKEASIYNDKLKSREGASELLGISPSSLADYELGNTKVVPVRGFAPYRRICMAIQIQCLVV